MPICNERFSQSQQSRRLRRGTNMRSCSKRSAASRFPPTEFPSSRHLPITSQFRREFLEFKNCFKCLNCGRDCFIKDFGEKPKCKNCKTEFAFASNVGSTTDTHKSSLQPYPPSDRLADSLISDASWARQVRKISKRHTGERKILGCGLGFLPCT